MEIGTAVGKLVIDTDGAEKPLTQIQKSLSAFFKGSSKDSEGLGEAFTEAGAKFAIAFAPLTEFMKSAVSSTTRFADSMTNVAAVMGLSQDKTKSLSDAILLFSKDTVAGPQKVAEAFYDIVGGVADTSLHMEILRRAVKLSEAGNSDLAGTTSALIAVMNGYSFAADKAGFASDVMTRMVGMGVGTMDQFAAALPNVTGLANSAGISFDKVGQMLAYLTTKGNTASEATTQLSSMMIAIIKPNGDMADALEKIGFKTGEAAIKNLGLIGTYKALLKAGYGGDMAALTGRVEALRGVTALTGDGVDEFFKQFTDGLNGATDAAQKIQLTGPTAQFNMLQSSIEVLRIKIGEKLVPVLVDLFNRVKPVVESIIQWIDKNPEAATTIAMVGGALALLGPVLMAIGMAISGLTAAFALLNSPILVLGGAIALVVHLFNTDWMGIGTAVKQLAAIITYYWAQVFGTGGIFQQLLFIFKYEWDKLWFGIATSFAQLKFVVEYYWNQLFGPQGGLNSAIKSFELLWGAVFDPDPAKGWLARQWENLFGQNGSLRPAINQILAFFGGIFGENGVIHMLWDKVFGPKGPVMTVWNSLFGEGKGIHKLISDAKTLVEGVVTKIGEAIATATQTIQGIIDKINGAIEAIRTFLGLSSQAPPPPDYTKGVPGQAASQMPIFKEGRVIGYKKLDNNGNVVGWLDANGNPTPTEPHDYFGPYDQGKAYLVGKKAQPELFAPGRGGSGVAIPNFDKVMQALLGGDGKRSEDAIIFNQGAVVIYANSASEGMAAAGSFQQELKMRMRKKA